MKELLYELEEFVEWTQEMAFTVPVDQLAKTNVDTGEETA